MPSLPDLKSKLDDALGRLSANERRLLTGLVLVALAAAPIKAAGIREEAAAHHDEVHAERDRLQQIAGRMNGSMGAELGNQRREVRGWSWQAESLEIGKVLVQDRITDMAQDAGLNEVDVKLGPKVEAAGEVQLVPLELSADFNWAGLSGFIAAMEAAGKGFVIDSVQMPDGDKPRLKLSLRAPLVVRPAATGQGGA